MLSILGKMNFRLAHIGMLPTPALAAISLWAIAPAYAQVAPAAPCFEVVIEKDESGKALLRLPIKVISTEADGSRTVVQIDPQCLNELAARRPPTKDGSDKFAAAEKGVDTALDVAKKNGLSDTDAQKIAANLNRFLMSEYHGLALPQC